MAERFKHHDAYLAEAAPFAREILTYLRAMVHETCPEITETIKWGFPHFEYHGAVLCSMAGFKQHASFGFRLGKEIEQSLGRMVINDKTGMGNFGLLRSLNDLPHADVLRSYLLEGMRLIDKGVKATRPKQEVDDQIFVPMYLAKAIAENEKVRSVFDSFSPGKRKEYIQWITEAKTEETRLKRLGQALEWIAEGKSRNWKYERR